MDELTIKSGNQKIAKVQLTIDRNVYPGVIQSVFVVESDPDREAYVERTVRQTLKLEDKKPVFFCYENHN